MKEVREWLSFSLSALAALGAAYVFFRYDAKQKELDSQLGLLNASIAVQTREKNALDLAALKTSNLKIAKSLRSVPVRDGLRQLSFEYVLQNAASASVTISTVTVEAYTGTITRPITTGMALNAPTEPGPVRWAMIFRRANIIETQWQPRSCVNSRDPAASPRCISAAFGGGGTGVLAIGGATSQSGMLVIVPSKHVDLVGFFVTVGLHDGRGRYVGIVDRPDVPSGNLRTE